MINDLGYTVIITAMLWYNGSPVPYETDWRTLTFDSVSECREYVFRNKVELTEGLFELHGVDEKGNKLKTWEYYCRTEYGTEV